MSTNKPESGKSQLHRKLQLNKETIRILDDREKLQRAVGAGTYGYDCVNTQSCSATPAYC